MLLNDSNLILKSNNLNCFKTLQDKIVRDTILNYRKESQLKCHLYWKDLDTFIP